MTRRHSETIASKIQTVTDLTRELHSGLSIEPDEQMLTLFKWTTEFFDNSKFSRYPKVIQQRLVDTFTTIYNSEYENRIYYKQQLVAGKILNGQIYEVVESIAIKDQPLNQDDLATFANVIHSVNGFFLEKLGVFPKYQQLIENHPQILDQGLKDKGFSRIFFRFLCLQFESETDFSKKTKQAQFIKDICFSKIPGINFDSCLPQKIDHRNIILERPIESIMTVFGYSQEETKQVVCRTFLASNHEDQALSEIFVPNIKSQIELEQLRPESSHNLFNRYRLTSWSKYPINSIVDQVDHPSKRHILVVTTNYDHNHALGDKDRQVYDQLEIDLAKHGVALRFVEAYTPEDLALLVKRARQDFGRPDSIIIDIHTSPDSLLLGNPRASLYKNVVKERPLKRLYAHQPGHETVKEIKESLGRKGFLVCRGCAGKHFLEKLYRHHPELQNPHVGTPFDHTVLDRYKVSVRGDIVFAIPVSTAVSPITGQPICRAPAFIG